MSGECKQLEPLLHDYAEGWLSEAERERLLRHLGRCPACQERLRAWQAVSEALRALPRLPAPAAPTASPCEREPRFVIRLALALCLPTALWLAAFQAPIRPSALMQIAPYDSLARLTEQAQMWLTALWNWLQGML